MFSFTHLLVGLMFAALGTLALKYNFKLVGLTGHVDFIENKLGSGSTYFVFQVLAIIVTLSGLLYATGYGAPVMTWLLSPLKTLFSGFHGQS